MMVKKKNKVEIYIILIHIIFIIICASFILPLMLVLSASFSSEDFLNSSGFSLLPQGFTLEAYYMVFRNPGKIIDAYVVTASQAFIGTFLALIIMGLVAYPLSRDSFYFKKPITFFIFFTMLFGGGLIPSYIINTQWYGLGDNYLIYLVTGICSAWNIMIMRTFFQGLPISLVESAKIDGADELFILRKIIVPLSKPVLATIGFMVLVAKWNDWNTSLIYIRNDRLYTLQYLLQKILREAEVLKEMSEDVNFDMSSYTAPAESLRYALCVVAAGPMLLVFPFFQKYFSKGLTIGSVKG